MNKQAWIDGAEIIDAYRIFPRIFFGAYIWLCFYIAMWAMGLPTVSVEQAGIVSVIIGAGAAWFGMYNNSGRSYDTPAEIRYEKK